MGIPVGKFTRSRKVKKETDSLFGRVVRPTVVVDIYVGNIVVLTSEDFYSDDLFLKEAEAVFPELLDECKQRFKNNGKLDSELTVKQKRNLI